MNTKLNDIKEKIEKKYFTSTNTDDCLELIGLVREELDYLEEKCLKKKKK